MTNYNNLTKSLNEIISEIRKSENDFRKSIHQDIINLDLKFFDDIVEYTKLRKNIILLNTNDKYKILNTFGLIDSDLEPIPIKLSKYFEGIDAHIKYDQKTDEIIFIIKFFEEDSIYDYEFLSLKVNALKDDYYLVKMNIDGRYTKNLLIDQMSELLILIKKLIKLVS